MPTPPPCASLGPQCHEVGVTLRIGSLEEGPAAADHEATWLLGHTERISYSRLRAAGNDLLVDATLHVRCRFLKVERPPTGEPTSPPTGRCTAHGFLGRLPPATRGAVQPRRLDGDRFRIVEDHHQRDLELSPPPPPSGRHLPVIVEDLDGENPCSIAPCSTADHKRGSACCRDLQIEILCRPDDRELEALVRSRQSPYLCKVDRESKDSLEAEMISACDYLDDRRENCTLHGRLRSDGRPAKPELCSEWPEDGRGLHPGCIWYVPPRKRAKRQSRDTSLAPTVQSAPRLTS